MTVCDCGVTLALENSQRQIEFSHPLEHVFANSFRSQMINHGYSDWAFNMNEDQDIIGIYGPCVNALTGEIAELIIQMLTE
jgi:hypothetical protein